MSLYEKTKAVGNRKIGQKHVMPRLTVVLVRGNGTEVPAFVYPSYESGTVVLRKVQDDEAFVVFDNEGKYVDLRNGKGVYLNATSYVQLRQ